MLTFTCNYDLFKRWQLHVVYLVDNPQGNQKRPDGGEVDGLTLCYVPVLCFELVDQYCDDNVNQHAEDCDSCCCHNDLFLVIKNFLWREYYLVFFAHVVDGMYEDDGSVRCVPEV